MFFTFLSILSTALFHHHLHCRSVHSKESLVLWFLSIFHLRFFYLHLTSPLILNMWNNRIQKVRMIQKCQMWTFLICFFLHKRKHGIDFLMFCFIYLKIYPLETFLIIFIDCNILYIMWMWIIYEQFASSILQLQTASKNSLVYMDFHIFESYLQNRFLLLGFLGQKISAYVICIVEGAWLG